MQSTLAGIKVGFGQPVRVMGVINVSPESFFKASVATDARTIAETARALEAEGADFIDVGAMSTAPYLKTQISEEEEAYRLKDAVKSVKRMCRIPVSIDTFRALPAQAGLDAGADILNDIKGFHGNEGLIAIAKRFRGLILMAHPVALDNSPKGAPINTIKKILAGSLKRAKKAGVSLNKIAVDPGIGFFRDTGMPWWQWDAKVLQEIGQLTSLGVPVLAGVSRKSFIGEILNVKNPNDRLSGSLAATAAAVLNGATIIRTHDVKETKEAVRIAEILRKV